MEQGQRESRRLWRHVTVGLKRNRISAATTAKRWIEQRQREEARQRQVCWQTFALLSLFFSSKVIMAFGQLNLGGGCSPVANPEHG